MVLVTSIYYNYLAVALTGVWNVNLEGKSAQGLDYGYHICFPR
jgi:hypothetical protein